jgi:capsular polysaccharide transport system ATP-binding protein
MLGFIDGTKYFKTVNGIQTVVDNTSFIIEKNEKIGILGDTGSGKSTVIKILSRMLPLNKGLIINECLTWFLGYSGAFHPYLTANENIKIVAQLNYLNPIDLKLFCQEFTGFSNDEFNSKISAFSGGMRAKLSYAVSLAIPCDFFLADDKLSVGDEVFRMKCEVALELRLKNSGLVFFTRNSKLTKNSCTKHGILKEGKIILYNSHEEACYFFHETTAMAKVC